MFSYFPDLGGIETTMVYYIQRLLSGHELYPHPESAPFYFLQYTPGYYLVASFIGKVLGVQGADVHSVYILGRGLSLSFHIIILAVVFKFLTRFFGVSKWFSLISITLIILCLYGLQVAVRSDAMKTCLVIVSIWCLFKFISEKHTLHLLLASFFIVLAVYTKQDALQFVFLSFLVLLKIQRAAALKYIFYTSTGVILCSTIFYFLYGEIFILSNFKGINQGVSLPYFYDFLKASIPYILFFIFVIYRFYTTPDDENPFRQSLYILFLGSFIFSTFLGLKWGSSPVYYTETMIFAIILLFSYQYNIKWNLSFVINFTAVASIIALIFKMYFPVYQSLNNKIEKINFQNREDLAMQIKNQLAPGEFILTFDKPLINHLSEKALFPMFEAEFPQFLPYGASYSGSPKLLFDYSEFNIILANKRLKLYIKNSKDEIPSDFLNFSLNDFNFKETSYSYEVFQSK